MNTVQRDLLRIEIQSLQTDLRMVDGKLSSINMMLKRNDISMRVITASLQERSDLIQKKNDIINAINDKKHEYHIACTAPMEEAPARMKQKHRVSMLRSLSDKYVEFAADHTRISSMRQMAAQFAKEIDDIINVKGFDVD